MEILDVVRTPIGPVNVNTSFRIQFSLLGAAGVRTPGFEFPFWNDSLTQNLLEFLSKGSIGFLVLPKQDGELTYTGESLSPVWIGYNEDFFEMTGETEATDPGTYRVTFTPKEHYEWLDGGQESREVTWKIRAKYYLYGFDLTNSNSNPSTRVVYPDEVDNANFTPAKMNFGGSFSYGDWPSTPGEKFMPQPCMLNYDGTVYEYLNPNDYTKTIDGKASKVADISFAGNAMMEWPKIWTKRWESNGVYHFRCSDTQIDSTYECWCNYDRLDNQIPNFYTPIYVGSKDSSNRLRSISGQSAMTSQTVATGVSYAHANGSDWHIEVMADQKLLEDLVIMLCKTTNSQEAIGYGIVNSSATNTSGSLNTKGLFWGSNDQTSGVKVFGMEHVWGNLWRRVDGYIYNPTVGVKVKGTRGRKDGTTVSDYNTTGDGYKTLPNSIFSGTSGTGITSMVSSEYGRFPVKTGGSTTTYECDVYLVTSSTANSNFHALCGHRYDGTDKAGLFAVAVNNQATATSAAWIMSPSCKPLLKT